MTIIDQLLNNDCISCKVKGIKNANHINDDWLKNINGGHWPKPFQEPKIDPKKVKVIAIGQDPTIDDTREIKYVLEADNDRSKLGMFIREIVSLFPPNISFDEFYFTNLVKCRFTEKPGKNKRNISDFLDQLAENCYSTFLQHEIRLFSNSKYILTFGRDTFLILSKLLDIDHPPKDEFKYYYGTPFAVDYTVFKRKCYLIPLPHQPTYDYGKRYTPYTPTEIKKKLESIKIS